MTAHANGSAGTRSLLEDRFLETWTGPEPVVNAKVDGIEIDGPGHERPLSRAADRERDAALGAAGWTVRRIPSRHG